MWDDIDAVLLGAIEREETSLAQLAAVSGFPRDAVAGLVAGYLDARYATQPLPGCDRYRITLTGRAHLRSLTAHTMTDTRKAA